MCWCWQLCIGKANPPTWRTIIIAVYFFIIFFLLNGDKWPFRFVALKFKCTNIYKQSACSVLCFIKKGGGGVGWKRWGVGDMKEWGKLSFWGAGMEKEGKQSLWWLIKHTHISNSDKGWTLETLALKLFTVAKLCYQLGW